MDPIGAGGWVTLRVDGMQPELTRSDCTDGLSAVRSEDQEPSPPRQILHSKRSGCAGLRFFSSRFSDSRYAFRNWASGPCTPMKP